MLSKWRFQNAVQNFNSSPHCGKNKFSVRDEIKILISEPSLRRGRMRKQEFVLSQYSLADKMLLRKRYITQQYAIK